MLFVACRHGKGVLASASHRYEGDWFEDKQHGEGLSTRQLPYRFLIKSLHYYTVGVIMHTKNDTGLLLTNIVPFLQLWQCVLLLSQPCSYNSVCVLIALQDSPAL